MLREGFWLRCHQSLNLYSYARHGCFDVFVFYITPMVFYKDVFCVNSKSRVFVNTSDVVSTDYTVHHEPYFGCCLYCKVVKFSY